MEKLKIEEVAVLMGCSSETINKWYRYQKNHPEDKIFKKLPQFQQDGEKQTRYWNREDVYKLIEFRTHLPRGRNGIMGKYHGKGTKNGSNKINKKSR